MNDAGSLGRRDLSVASVDQILPEAQRLADAQSVMLVGNWGLGQILEHLGRAFYFSVEGINYRAPWRLRLLGWFLKGRIINGSMPPGFKAPAGMADILEADTSITTQAGLATLCDGFEKYRAANSFAEHPIFGRLTQRQWDRLHCNHAAMHLSFVIPDEAESPLTD